MPGAVLDKDDYAAALRLLNHIADSMRVGLSSDDCAPAIVQVHEERVGPSITMSLWNSELRLAITTTEPGCNIKVPGPEIGYLWVEQPKEKTAKCYAVLCFTGTEIELAFSPEAKSFPTAGDVVAVRSGPEDTARAVFTWIFAAFFNQASGVHLH